MWLFLFASFVAGIVIGSFINVFVIRYGTGRAVKGRSSCAVCGKKLAWYELIPLLSFVIQKGRCRGCETRISLQYPLVELCTGLLFMWAVWASSAVAVGPILYSIIALSWLVIFLLVSLSVYDIKHMIIPDGLVYTFIVVSFLSAIHRLPSFSMLDILSMLGGGCVVALPLFLLWAVSRGRWMGFGDVKLALGIGFLLGMVRGLSALVFAVWVGACVSLIVLTYERIRMKMRGLDARAGGFTMKSEIPFGPFIVIGTLLVLFTGITLMDVIGMM